MAKTLAQLRAEKINSLPTRVAKVCLDQAALADVQRLEQEKNEVTIEAQRVNAGDEERSAPPRKMGERTRPSRLDEIDAELEALYDRMRESEGEVLLRAVPGGDWQRWKDAHPAREGNIFDNTVTYSVCNGVDLLDDLAKYVVSWNGEDLAAGDWDEWLADAMAPADVRDLVSFVVELHESRVAVPKSSTASSTTEGSDND